MAMEMPGPMAAFLYIEQEINAVGLEPVTHLAAAAAGDHHAGFERDVRHRQQRPAVRAADETGADALGVDIRLREHLHSAYLKRLQSPLIVDDRSIKGVGVAVAPISILDKTRLSPKRVLKNEYSTAGEK